MLHLWHMHALFFCPLKITSYRLWCYDYTIVFFFFFNECPFCSIRHVCVYCYTEGTWSEFVSVLQDRVTTIMFHTSTSTSCRTRPNISSYCGTLNMPTQAAKYILHLHWYKVLYKPTNLWLQLLQFSVIQGRERRGGSKWLEFSSNLSF